MKTKIDVLDKGYVRLVDYMGSDRSIVQAARVSYDGDLKTGADKAADDKLIEYLYANRHTCPFEAVEFQFEVKAPIFVVRQWHRHRTWSYNEISARYVELDDDFYLPDPKMVGRQSEKNRQGRLVRDNLRTTDAVAEEFIRDLQAQSMIGFDCYQRHLEAGIPRELARCFLGMNTYTRMYAKVDLHNLMHFLSLRLHSHAQWEIRQYAKALLELVEPIVPVAVGLIKRHLDLTL